MINHLKQNNLITESQRGFIKNVIANQIVRIS